jgi:hypothetical protein
MYSLTPNSVQAIFNPDLPNESSVPATVELWEPADDVALLVIDPGEEHRGVERGAPRAGRPAGGRLDLSRGGVSAVQTPQRPRRRLVYGGGAVSDDLTTQIIRQCNGALRAAYHLIRLGQRPGRITRSIR